VTARRTHCEANSVMLCKFQCRDGSRGTWYSSMADTSIAKAQGPSPNAVDSCSGCAFQIIGDTPGSLVGLTQRAVWQLLL
jgi:hypothetical protein